MSTHQASYRHYTLAEREEYSDRITAYLASLAPGTAVSARAINTAISLPRGNTAKDILWQMEKRGEVLKFTYPNPKKSRHVYMLAGRYQVRS